MERELDIRMAFAQALDGIGKHAGDRGGAAPQVDPPFAQLEVILDGQMEVVHALEDVDCDLVDELSQGRGAHPAPGAFEQDAPEALLKQFEAGRERRLGDVQFADRGRKTAFVDDGHEGLQAVDVQKFGQRKSLVGEKAALVGALVGRVSQTSRALSRPRPVPTRRGLSGFVPAERIAPARPGAL